MKFTEVAPMMEKGAKNQVKAVEKCLLVSGQQRLSY